MEMNRHAIKGILILLGIGFQTAHAALPAARSMHGVGCTLVPVGGTHLVKCPFVSDPDPYFAALSDGLYADFIWDTTGGMVDTSACRQSFTGGAIACGTPTVSSGGGIVDASVSGFGSIAGSPDGFDYFFVLFAVDTFHGDAHIYQPYGIAVY
jgi:hypothetical protein